MSRIFLSHSSINNAAAIAIKDWLLGQGWEDVFLDLDPERGLSGGERWQAALKRAAERCELVIFLISPAWVSSKWCLAEFLLAKNLNKRIVGVIVESTSLAALPLEMTAEWQIVDLASGALDYHATVAVPPDNNAVKIELAGEGLNRLRIGLKRAGLDAKFFVWPPDGDAERVPYRGLRPLESEDAGIFFGRDGPIVLGLDAIRGLRDAAPPRLFVILGASGSGKSSFLRAGLLPRLAREDRDFVPLPPIRPERAVISGENGLVSALEQAFRRSAIAQKRADIRTAVERGAEALAALLLLLANARSAQVIAGAGEAAARPPTLILPVDQAEELFRSEGAGEAAAFLALLRDLTERDDPHLIVLFTIRSDHYERLQTAKELEGLRQHTLSLPPMPQGSYADVIRGPARRLEGTPRPLKIDESLIDALLADIEVGGSKDALPLLAFTLERLYREYGGDGHLTLADYVELGRVKGSIEAAVERALKAADQVAGIPPARAERLELLRRGLIPWLAGIDQETGLPRRRVARRSEIPVASYPLIELFVEQRLLATDVTRDTGEVTIEPVHEALLRQWGLLQTWLTEDAGLLGLLDGVKLAARDWSANQREPSWLVHSDHRLVRAEQLSARPDLAASLLPADRDYIAACRAREAATTAAAKSTRLRTRIMQGATAAMVLLVAATAYFGYDYYLTATGRCSVASLYPYSVGRFEKQGDGWVEVKGTAVYARFKELRQDATFVYLVDGTRRKPLAGRSAAEASDFLVRIPKCGGEVAWSWSNPLQWAPFQVVTYGK